jgi:hypothetical protein
MSFIERRDDDAQRTWTSSVRTGRDWWKAMAARPQAREQQRQCGGLNDGKQEEHGGRCPNAPRAASRLVVDLDDVHRR